MLRAESRWVLQVAGAAVLAAACLGSPPGYDEKDAGDEPTADAGPDAAPGAAGLTFVWIADPDPPAQLDGDVTLTEVRLDLRDLRAIGDSAPGDERTSRDQLDLRWEDRDEPVPLVFEHAPPGLYSSLQFDIGGDGQGNAFLIRGTVVRDGMTLPFEISDQSALPVSVPLAFELQAGETRTIDVSLAIGAAVGDIDWSMVELDEGELELDEGPQLDEFRAALADGFAAGVQE